MQGRLAGKHLNAVPFADQTPFFDTAMRKDRIKALIRGLLPLCIVDALRSLLNVPRLIEKAETRRIFSTAADIPSYLDMEVLEDLQMRYPPSPEYGYDPRTLEKRGREKCAAILRLPGARQAKSFLELGCWDGMASCALLGKGKAVTAIDNRDTGFDERAARQGVLLRQMDATNLQFPDDSFDYIFSYDAFEHFAEPERVLQEAIRVVKAGG